PEGLDWIIESVPEKLDLKRAVLAEAEVRSPRHLASNTSAISITALAAGLVFGPLGPVTARALPLPPAPVAAPARGAALVRTGNHRGFGRVVFVFAAPVSYTLRQAGGQVRLRFSLPAAIPSAAGPRNVRAITGGTGRAVIAIAPRSTIRWMQLGDRVIVDVLDPAPRAAPLPLPPKPPPYPLAVTLSTPLPLPPKPPARAPALRQAALPLPHPVSRAPVAPAPGSATAAAAAVAAQLAPLLGHAPAPPSAAGPTPLLPAAAAAPVAAVAAAPLASSPPPAASPAAPSRTLGPAVPLSAGPAPLGAPPLALAAVPVILPPGVTGAAIRMPFAAGVGAAAFARGRDGMVVFDTPRPIDMAGVREVPILGAGTIRLLPAATLLRVVLPAHYQLRLARDTAGWTVAAVPSPPPVPPLAPQAIGGALWFALSHHGASVVVPDPETGGPLLVGTARVAGPGLAVVRRYPQFTLDPSWLGVVVAPLSDRLTLRARHGGFLLDASGVALALQTEPGSAAALADAASFSRRFDLPDLPTRLLYGRLLSALDAAATAPPLSRTRARLAEAQSMIGLGMGVEARGVLRLAAREDPAAA
ncbi:MAG: 3-hydroxyacyl-CoA dehydrogenase NAD-binding domain-containing protein, partial [Acetobacteraceae bacterium]